MEKCRMLNWMGSGGQRQDVVGLGVYPAVG
jgi:hypothetical protein